MGSALKEVRTEDSELDELAKEHGEIHVFSTRHGKVAFKAPSFADYQRFTDKITDGKGSKFASMRELALACRAYPAREDLLAIFEKMPGMVLQAATAIQELAGTEVEGEVKKG
jgi:hypothetical protein